MAWKSNGKCELKVMLRNLKWRERGESLLLSQGPIIQAWVAWMNLTMQTRMALPSQIFTCFCLLCAEIRGVHQHAQHKMRSFGRVAYKLSRKLQRCSCFQPRNHFLSSVEALSGIIRCLSPCTNKKSFKRGKASYSNKNIRRITYFSIR